MRAALKSDRSSGRPSGVIEMELSGVLFAMIASFLFLSPMTMTATLAVLATSSRIKRGGITDTADDGFSGESIEFLPIFGGISQWRGGATAPSYFSFIASLFLSSAPCVTCPAKLITTAAAAAFYHPGHMEQGLNHCCLLP